MASNSIIFDNNTAVIRLDGLKDQNGTFQNDATVTMESIVDEATGTAVTGVTVPLNMPYVNNSNGRYEGQIVHTAVLTVGTRYLATVKAVALGGEVGEWEERLLCRTRKG